MTIIDILNRIANRDYIPIKIKWRDRIWIYDNRSQDYYKECTDKFYENDLGLFAYGFNYLRTLDFINDEVEINNLESGNK